MTSVMVEQRSNEGLQRTTHTPPLQPSPHIATTPTPTPTTPSTPAPTTTHTPSVETALSKNINTLYLNFLRYISSAIAIAIAIPACMHSLKQHNTIRAKHLLAPSLFQTQTRLIPLKVQLFESFLLPLFASPLCFTSLHTSCFMLHFTTSLRITTQHITSILSHHHPGLEREADHIRSYQQHGKLNLNLIQHNHNNYSNDNSEQQQQLQRQL